MLLDVPAVIHFASCEPLLGPLELAQFTELDWVIIGGETGHGARPMDAAWARDVRDQCVDAGTSFFFKQWGRWGADGIKRSKKANGRLLLGRIWDNKPQKLVEPVAAR